MASLPVPFTHLPSRLLSACTAILAFAACDPTPPPSSSRTPVPVVVASFFPLYDFAKALADTNFTVHCLTPPGADPHGTDPTPEMARKVAHADLVLLMGLGMDGWVARLAQAERSPSILTVSDGIPFLPAPDHGHSHHHAHAHAHNHPHPASDASQEDPHPNADPHLWLDPLRARTMVTSIAGALTQLKPELKPILDQRLASYLAELERLHQDFESGLANLPERRVVTFHGAFAYLFDRYHLETAGVLQPFPGVEPSAVYLRHLVNRMNELGLKTIFAEPQLPSRTAHVIAQEIRGQVERLDPCETILPDQPEATYLDRQRANLNTLRRTLGASAEP